MYLIAYSFELFARPAPLLVAPRTACHPARASSRKSSRRALPRLPAPPRVPRFLLTRPAPPLGLTRAFPRFLSHRRSIGLSHRTAAQPCASSHRPAPSPLAPHLSPRPAPPLAPPRHSPRLTPPPPCTLPRPASHPTPLRLSPRRAPSTRPPRASKCPVSHPASHRLSHRAAQHRLVAIGLVRLIELLPTI